MVNPMGFVCQNKCSTYGVLIVKPYAVVARVVRTERRANDFMAFFQGSKGGKGELDSSLKTGVK